jgi:hypothetical protein
MTEDADQSQAGIQSRLSIAKAVLATLLEAYEALGDVRVTIVTFETGSQLHFGWGSVDDAIASLNTIVANGLTNYAAALDTAEDAWAAGGKLPGDTNNVVYFLSDGVPTERDANGDVQNIHLTDAQKAAWDNFLENPSNGIDHVYAVGIGDDITPNDPDLVSVAQPDGNSVPPGDVLYVHDPAADLSSILVSTIEVHPVSGNVLTGVDTSGVGDNGVPGQADVGGDGTTHIDLLSYDGANPAFTIKVEWDGVSANLVVTGGQNVTTNNHEVSFDTEHGKMTFDFDTGDYTFAATEVKADTDVVFHYETKDADGDVDVIGGTDVDNSNSKPGGADLVITIVDSAPVPSLAAADDSHVSALAHTPTTANDHELALLLAS